MSATRDARRRVADLVVGSSVAQWIQSNETLWKLLFNNWTMNNGNLNNEVLAPGATRLGQLNFGGFRLDVFSIWEAFPDDNGVMQQLFPATSAMVAAPGCGHTLYGRVDQMERDELIHSYAGRRIPRYTAHIESSQRKIRIASRPLTAPHRRSPWVYAPNVVS